MTAAEKQRERDKKQTTKMKMKRAHKKHKHKKTCAAFISYFLELTLILIQFIEKEIAKSAS